MFLFNTTVTVIQLYNSVIYSALPENNCNYPEFNAIVISITDCECSHNYQYREQWIRPHTCKTFVCKVTQILMNYGKSVRSMTCSIVWGYELMKTNKCSPLILCGYNEILIHDSQYTSTTKNILSVVQTHRSNFCLTILQCLNTKHILLHTQLFSMRF